jgi:hypothetical protein
MHSFVVESKALVVEVSWEPLRETEYIYSAQYRPTPTDENTALLANVFEESIFASEGWPTEHAYTRSAETIDALSTWQLWDDPFSLSMGNRTVVCGYLMAE